jgi:hypothetical protein
VSDGKETCQGDPAVAARALAGEGITVHTVGFIVDTAARGQLQAIARATGGTYFDAPVGPELPDTLNQALSACSQTVVLLPGKPEPGKLLTTSAQWLASHPIFNAETGEKVGAFDSASPEITLPAGIYEVQFGPARWKAIEVLAGETTTISPAELRVDNLVGNMSVTIVDTETGEKHGSVNRVSPQATLMPGVYDLLFGKTEWRFVKVDGGQTTTLKSTQVTLARDLQWEKARVVTADGTVVARFDAVTHQAALPPGDYIVEVDDNKIPFAAAEGAVLELKPQ